MRYRLETKLGKQTSCTHDLRHARELKRKYYARTNRWLNIEPAADDERLAAIDAGRDIQDDVAQRLFEQSERRRVVVQDALRFATLVCELKQALM